MGLITRANIHYHFGNMPKRPFGGPCRDVDDRSMP
jgi:hypothetical protein